KELNGLFVCNGPGSYTGIRLGEGIAQVFEMLNIPIYSFHHYKVPKLLGHESGQWSCHAFKGEIYNYLWDANSSEEQLVHASKWQPIHQQVFSNQPEGPWREVGHIAMSEVIKNSA